MYIAHQIHLLHQSKLAILLMTYPAGKYNSLKGKFVH